ncbi:uncharacterized protein B0T23DRAFT_220188 [Neurospora hispaniola]|uniref:Uncharacterized protein n=1 Tax=Neurospora hispaniola TaxID=588809 RepID=A0AAJ0MNP2_9PEZI|nr:hypothetical protein B0T23DRAFT_220188 [Neurospora hispaniola]
MHSGFPVAYSSPQIFPLLPNLPITTFFVFLFGHSFWFLLVLDLGFEASWTDPTISKLIFLIQTSPLLRACSGPPPPYTKNIPHDPDSSQKAWQRKVQPPAFPYYQDSGHQDPSPWTFFSLSGLTSDFPTQPCTNTQIKLRIHNCRPGTRPGTLGVFSTARCWTLPDLFYTTIRGSSRSQTATVSTCSLTTPTPPALLKLRQSLRLRQTIRVALFPVSKPHL